LRRLNSILSFTPFAVAQKYQLIWPRAIADAQKRASPRSATGQTAKWLRVD
jgi:hypothetical protein